jgi:hypothetical protein
MRLVLGPRAATLVGGGMAVPPPTEAGIVPKGEGLVTTVSEVGGSADSLLSDGNGR